MTAIAERMRGYWDSSARYLREVRTEMKKVTWPQQKEVMGSTVVVIISTLIVSVFLFMADVIVQKLLGLILR